MFVHGKNGSKIRISSIRGPYSSLIRRYGAIHIFLAFEKYRVSAQNAKGFDFSFTNKRLFMVKIGQKFIYGVSVRHFGAVNKF
jgi:hypothetical protein